MEAFPTSVLLEQVNVYWSEGIVTVSPLSVYVTLTELAGGTTVAPVYVYVPSTATAAVTVYSPALVGQPSPFTEVFVLLTGIADSRRGISGGSRGRFAVGDGLIVLEHQRDIHQHIAIHEVRRLRVGHTLLNILAVGDGLLLGGDGHGAFGDMDCHRFARNRVIVAGNISKIAIVPGLEGW